MFYPWLFKKLGPNTAVRTVVALVLIAVIVGMLWACVYPEIAPRIIGGNIGR